MPEPNRSGEEEPPTNGSGSTLGAYDWSIGTPSEAVVETVAAASGREPTALEPLYRVIDPDALDALFRRRDDDSRIIRVSFDFNDHLVTVQSDGTVVVQPAEE